jgi:hypothetical protein
MVTYQVFWQEESFQQIFLEAFLLLHGVFPKILLRRQIRILFL